MPSKPQLYQIWTDGSYRHATYKVGAGWLIRGEGVPEREGHRTIMTLHGQDRPHGSDIAELFAVASALSQLPPGASAHVRLDCKNVSEWLLKRDICTTGKRGAPLLSRLFNEIMQKVDIMPTFDVSHMGGKLNANLQRVHILSRQASSHGL